MDKLEEMDEIEKFVLLLTVKLYTLAVSRSDVQKIIHLFSIFIKDNYVPHTLKKLDKSLYKAVTDEVHHEIHRLLNKLSDPFEKYRSEDKRLRLYTRLGLYVEPEVLPMATLQVNKVKGTILNTTDKEFPVVRIPLMTSLKRLLELDGLLLKIEEYMRYLKVEKNFLINFIQGDLWKSQVAKFPKLLDENTVLLPLLSYFDDVEIGNTLGSHAGTNQIGAVYTWIPCLPPWFSSKLDSIIFSDIFHTTDRKRFGNAAAFQFFLQDLTNLYDYGIDLCVGNRKIKAYFIPTLIIGDNLGINSILGFTSSFANTTFCRVCYGGEDIKTWTKENVSALRTVELYEIDIINKSKYKEKGLKERCIFNSLANFHVIENFSFDCMHDLLEGVCSYVLAKLIIQSVEVEKFFTIDYLNYKLQSTHFGFESGEVPPRINIEYLIKNQKLKMSAAETLFFCRYLRMLIGDLVPPNNQYWELYIYLRNITHVVTAPILTRSDVTRLSSTVEMHHELYLELTGELTPKFHSLVHYARAILRNGPLMKLSSMRFESFHTRIKKSIDAACAHKNILKSIGIRTQLSMMDFKFQKYEDESIEYGQVVDTKLARSFFYEAADKKEYKNITVNNIKYSKDTIIVTDNNEVGIEFGQIENIFEVDKTIKFKFILFETQHFDDNFFAYNVKLKKQSFLINFSDLGSKTPCLLFPIEDSSFIVLKTML